MIEFTKGRNEETVKRSICRVLSDSHVAVAAIAMLLLWSLDGAFQAVWPPVSRALDFLFTAVAILDIPYFSPTLTVLDRTTFIVMCAYLYSAVISLSAAWLLSRWIYGMGPLSTLAMYRGRIIGRRRA